MYIVIKAGHYLHEAIGIYDRIDVAKAFAAEALSQERDDYHQYKIYYRAPEAAVAYTYPVMILSNAQGWIYVDTYIDGVLQSCSLYEKEDL